MKKICFIAIILFIAGSATAQVIPANKQVQWSGAGIPGTNPVITNEINVMSFGAYGDSIHNDAVAIANAIASLAGHACSGHKNESGEGQSEERC